MSESIKHKSGRFITVIGSKEVFEDLISKLREKYGVNEFFHNSARGITIIDSNIIGKFIYIEKGILTVLVDEGISDDVFGFIYEYLDIQNKPGSFIYMGEVNHLIQLALNNSSN
jgi:hypothetical protein